LVEAEAEAEVVVEIGREKTFATMCEEGFEQGMKLLHLLLVGMMVEHMLKVVPPHLLYDYALELMKTTLHNSFCQTQHQKL
jgi:hypothetical protein